MFAVRDSIVAPYLRIQVGSFTLFCFNSFGYPRSGRDIYNNPSTVSLERIDLRYNKAVARNDSLPQFELSTLFMPLPKLPIRHGLSKSLHPATLSDNPRCRERYTKGKRLRQVLGLTVTKGLPHVPYLASMNRTTFSIRSSLILEKSHNASSHR